MEGYLTILKGFRARLYNKSYISKLLFFLIALSITNQVYSQCNRYKDYGQDVVQSPICAPVDFKWRLRYEVVTGSTVQFMVDWDDGTKDIISPPSYATANPLLVDYIDTVTHVYPKKGDKCQYEPKAYVIIDGSTCQSSLQSVKVTVWDNDTENGGNPRINPMEYRICLGESATINFKDNSIWNCVPASGETDRKNNYGRWVQWIYGVGAAGNRIPGAEVNSNPAPYPFNGAIEYQIGPIETPFSTSYNVSVPPTFNPADIGKEFVVELRNWNVCNPYDADTLDGNPFNPVSGNTATGDNMYIRTTAKIVIVEKSDPNFRTRLDNSSGIVTTEFCLGDRVYFQDLTPGITNASFEYEWKIYEDESGTQLGKSSTSKNAAYTFASKGRKMIELTVRDKNTVGKCGGTIVKYIDILSAADAAIAVTDKDDQPLNDLCYDPVNNNSFTVKLTDISTDFDPLKSAWQWNFHHFDGTSYQMDSTKSGAGSQASFILTYTQPGSYMAELIATATGVDCETRDTSYVHIYHQPIADFTATSVCIGDSTAFTSTATIPAVVNNDDIEEYEWDFDYDGTSFNADVTENDAAPIQYKFNVVGTFTVAHRVTTAKGGCSDMIVKQVEVKPSPYITFKADKLDGCSPLKVTFTLDTLLANQPTQVTSYTWHIKDLKTGTVNSIMADPPTDTFTAPEFVNTQSSVTDHQYEVWLEAKAANACDAVSNPVTITVYPEPSSDFTITNLSGGDNNCSPRNYKFQVMAATQAFNPDSYQWTVMDERDSSVITEVTLPGSNPDFDYTIVNEESIAKKYRIRLLASRAGLCFSATEKLVTVNPLPSSEFTVTLVDADCQLAIYQVSALQKGLVYQWNIDPLPHNNPDLSQDQFELVYDKKLGSASSVTIELTTTNVIGCESVETTKNITVDPREVIDASFYVSPSILEIPDRTVNITSNIKSEDWTYFWDFGDGTHTISSTPETHTYETHGEYWIKVLVSGQYCYEEDSAKVIIKQTLPVVDFDFSTIEGCLPLTVNFFNKSEYADEESYLWDFGDGKTSTAINPSYTYSTSGIYTVTLKASNSLGVEVKKQTDLIIDLSQGPKADFNIRLARAYLPDQDIIFSNQSQRASLYHWDFGDGTTSNLQDPAHQYEASGHYEITLIVQNELGCSDTLVKQLFVEPLVPEVDFAYDPPTGCRPLTVKFRNLSRYAEPGTYRWSFGEGQGVAADENPTYTYYEPGLYTVTLEASNSIGVTATEKKEFSVEVYENPIAAFSLRPDKVFLGENVYFVNLSLNGRDFYWDFGDGNTSTDFEPAHQYENAGTYDITLVAENEHGCIDTLKKISTVIVEEGGKIQVPNAFTPSTYGPGSTDAPGSASKNDVFLPFFEGVTSFHMMIYNRWGELLFESYEKSYGWDGYYKGKLCAKDVYVYKLELKFSDGQSNTVVGDVTLLR